MKEFSLLKVFLYFSLIAFSISMIISINTNDFVPFIFVSVYITIVLPISFLIDILRGDSDVSKKE